MTEGERLPDEPTVMCRCCCQTGQASAPPTSMLRERQKGKEREMESEKQRESERGNEREIERGGGI